MMRDGRPRSPESSRRRRRDRVHSSELPPATMSSIPPYHQQQQQQQQQHQYQYQQQQQHYQQPVPRTRAGSSSTLSSSSSTSDSLLNISAPATGRSGFFSFFRSPTPPRRRKSHKRKTRFLRFGNSSSSSVDEGLAYGRGYISRSRVDELAARERERRNSGRDRHDGSDPDRPAPPRRAQTDEEILELGRQLSKMARDQNREDLARAGRRPPSQLVATAAAINKLRRQGTNDSTGRGIGSSKPHRRHSPGEDSEWESASEDEDSFSDDGHSGLAYGSTAALPALPAPDRRASMRPPEVIRPPHRKSSAVDPRMFGPVNSLRGLINTPCGFDGRPQPPRPSDPHYVEPIPPIGSASIESRPMQTVYPVPTSDPARFDAARSAVVSAQQQSSGRPDPVPIQHPKPIAPPVNKRVLEDKRYAASESRDSRDSRRRSDGQTLAQVAVAGVAGAAISAAMGSDRQDRDRDSHRERDERRDYDDRRDRRSRRDGVKIVDERDDQRRDEKRDSRYDDKADRYRSRQEEYEREKERRRQERQREEAAAAEPRRENPRENPRETRRESYRSEYGESEAKQADAAAAATAARTPVDPFQFLVDNSAFSTPKRPLTPMVVTVEREPDFSALDTASLGQPDDGGRRSRRDSFEQEMRDAKKVYEETQRSTAPIEAAAIAAGISAIALEEREHKRGRDPEPRSPRDEPSEQARDKVQEEADRYYRETKIARKIAEEQIRSRSASPNPSVVEKYNEEEEEPVIRIVTPPEMDRKPEKSIYDGPDANVRIDNKIFPHELDRFRLPRAASRGRPDTLVAAAFMTRDPSCERERPMLNLVYPTPLPTPSIEKQLEKSIPAQTDDAKDKPEEADAPRSVVMGPRGDVIESSEPAEVVTKDVPSDRPEAPSREVEPEPEPQPKLARKPKPKTSKKSGWGILAAAVAGAGAGAAASSAAKDSEPTEPREVVEPAEPREVVEPTEPREVVEPAEPRERTGLAEPKETVEPKPERRKSNESERTGSPIERDLPAPSRARDGDLDDGPPPAPGPKPPASPRSAQMPGAFADDLDFAATVAAGLQDAGFDPNIVIEDPTFRRRDSPPGSNEPLSYQRPFAQTVTDLGVEEPTARAVEKREEEKEEREAEEAEEEELADDDFQRPTKLSKKEKRKQEKEAKRRQSEPRGSESILEEGLVEEPRQEDFEEVKLSKKEQRKRDKAEEAERAREEMMSSKELPRSEPADEVVGDDEWATLTSKKNKKTKKSKKGSSVWDEEPAPDEQVPRSETLDTNNDNDTATTTTTTAAAAAEDEWADPPSKNKGKKSETGSSVGDDNSPEPSELPRSDTIDTNDAGEDDWADAPSKKKKGKKTKNSASTWDVDPTPADLRRSETVDTSHGGDNEYVEAPSKKKGKKLKKTASAWEDEPAPPSDLQRSETMDTNDAGEDEWAGTPSSKKKKGKKGKKSNSAWDDSGTVTPTEQRTISIPVDAFDDIKPESQADANDDWDMPKKSKKKSKRDSASQDSRATSTAPTEVSTTSSGAKSKKDRRKSAPIDEDEIARDYDEPDIGEPPDRKRDKYRPADRDVSSVVSDPTRYDDRFESRSNGSRGDEGDDTKSAVSAPIGKANKGAKRSSGTGFFGLFKGSNGTEERENGSAQPETADDDSNNNNDSKRSFLGNAGTLGAGVGLAGAVAAVAAHASRSNATHEAPHEKEPSTSAVVEEPARAASPGLDIVDPEIVERAIKPAIDPQFGDLLPLPPSEPGTPGTEMDDDYPDLPDSRPETPPEQERSLIRERMSARRRTAYETPTKSPSQTAVPITFRVPPSPGVFKTPPLQSPVTPGTETVHRRLARPTSWDSSREIKPLRLVEHARSLSHIEVQPTDLMPSGSLGPELPAPEQLASRDMEPAASQRPRLSSGELRIDTSIANEEALASDHLGSQDTTPKAGSAPHHLEYLDAHHSSDAEASDVFEDAASQFHPSATQSPVEPQSRVHDEGGLSPLTRASEALPSVDRPPHHGQHERDLARDAAASELTLRDDGAVAEEPSPIEPMSKDRSSYLLHATPPSIKKSGVDDGSPISPSLSPSQRKIPTEPSIPEGESDVAVHTALGVAAGGLIAAAVAASLRESKSQETVRAIDDIEEAVPGSPKVLAPETEGHGRIQELDKVAASDSPRTASPERESVTLAESETLVAPESELTLGSTVGPDEQASRAPLEDIIPGTSLETDVAQNPAEEPFEPFESKKGKKGKKKQRKSQIWEPDTELADQGSKELSIHAAPEASPQDDLGSAATEEQEPVPSVPSRSASVSKKGKKKKGKKFSAWEPEEPEVQDGEDVSREASTTATPEVSQPEIPPQETSQPEDLEAVATEEKEPGLQLPSISSSVSKKAKKKKGKKFAAWEPEEPSQDDAIPATPPQDEPPLETGPIAETIKSEGGGDISLEQGESEVLLPVDSQENAMQEPPSTGDGDSKEISLESSIPTELPGPAAENGPTASYEGVEARESEPADLELGDSISHKHVEGPTVPEHVQNESQLEDIKPDSQTIESQSIPLDNKLSSQDQEDFSLSQPADANASTTDAEFALPKSGKKKKKGRKMQVWEPEQSEPALPAEPPLPDQASRGPDHTFSQEPLGSDAPLQPIGERQEGQSREIDLEELAIQEKTPESFEPVNIGKKGKKKKKAQKYQSWEPEPEPESSEQLPTVEESQLVRGEPSSENKVELSPSQDIIPSTVIESTQKPSPDVWNGPATGLDGRESATSQPLSESGVQPDTDSAAVPLPEDHMPASTGEEEQAGRASRGAPGVAPEPTARGAADPSGSGAELGDQGPISDDKSVDDTPQSVLDTADLVPDKQQMVATDATPTDTQPLNEAILQDTSPDEPVQSQPSASQPDDAIDSSSPPDDPDQSPVMEQPPPSGHVDWEAETASGKKGGKKGKKKRQGRATIDVQDAPEIGSSADVAANDRQPETASEPKELDVADVEGQELPAQSSSGSLTEPVPTQEDLWPETGKKSKKGKKKKGSPASFFPEDEPPSTRLVQEPAQLEPSGDAIATPDDLSLEGAAAQDDQPEEQSEFTLPVKKSKKGKKKRDSLGLPSQQAEDIVSQEDPATSLQEPAAVIEDEIAPEVEDSSVPVEESQPADETSQADDIWGVPVKKGKKSKKKRDSRLPAEDVNREDRPAPSLEPSSPAEEEAIESTPLVEEEPIPEVSQDMGPSLKESQPDDQTSQADDIWDVPAKKSKKGKKKRDSQPLVEDATQDDPVASSQGPPSLIEEEATPEVPEGTSASLEESQPSDQTPQADDIWGFSTKKGKKGKKKRDSARIQSLADDPIPAVAAAGAPSLESESQSQDESISKPQFGEEQPPQQPLEQTAPLEETWDLPAKKGKKGKKRQSTIVSLADEEPSAGDVQPTGLTTEAPADLPSGDAVSGTRELDQPFEVSTKKGKKSKKKRQSIPIDFSQEDVVDSEPKSIVEEPSAPVESEISRPSSPGPSTIDDASSDPPKPRIDDIAEATVQPQIQEPQSPQKVPESNDEVPALPESLGSESGLGEPLAAKILDTIPAASTPEIAESEVAVPEPPSQESDNRALTSPQLQPSPAPLPTQLDQGARDSAQADGIDSARSSSPTPRSGQEVESEGLRPASPSGIRSGEQDDLPLASDIAASPTTADNLVKPIGMATNVVERQPEESSSSQKLAEPPALEQPVEPLEVPDSQSQSQVDIQDPPATPGSRRLGAIESLPSESAVETLDTASSPEPQGVPKPSRSSADGIPINLRRSKNIKREKKKKSRDDSGDGLSGESQDSEQISSTDASADEPEQRTTDDYKGGDEDSSGPYFLKKSPKKDRKKRKSVTFADDVLDSSPIGLSETAADAQEPSIETSGDGEPRELIDARVTGAGIDNQQLEGLPRTAPKSSRLIDEDELLDFELPKKSKKDKKKRNSVTWAEPEVIPEPLPSSDLAGPSEDGESAQTAPISDSHDSVEEDWEIVDLPSPDMAASNVEAQTPVSSQLDQTNERDLGADQIDEVSRPSDIPQLEGSTVSPRLEPTRLPSDVEVPESSQLESGAATPDAPQDAETAISQEEEAEPSEFFVAKKSKKGKKQKRGSKVIESIPEPVAESREVPEPQQQQLGIESASQSGKDALEAGEDEFVVLPPKKSKKEKRKGKKAAQVGVGTEDSQTAAPEVVDSGVREEASQAGQDASLEESQPLQNIDSTSGEPQPLGSIQPSVEESRHLEIVDSEPTTTQAKSEPDVDEPELEHTEQPLADQISGDEKGEQLQSPVPEELRNLEAPISQPQPGSPKLEAGPVEPRSESPHLASTEQATLLDDSTRESEAKAIDLEKSEEDQLVETRAEGGLPSNIPQVVDQTPKMDLGDDAAAKQTDKDVSGPEQPSPLQTDIEKPSEVEPSQEAEDFFPITRKQSKKEKRKAKKESRSWEPEETAGSVSREPEPDTSTRAAAADVVSETTKEASHNTPELSTSQEIEPLEFPLSQKKSKKDKRKAKKESQSWEPEETADNVSREPEPDTSTRATLEDVQSSAAADIVPESTEEASNTPEPPTSQEVEPMEFPLSRKASKKDKKRKGTKTSDSEPASGISTPKETEIQVPVELPTAEDTGPVTTEPEPMPVERGLEAVEEDNAAIVDDFPEWGTKSKKSKKKKGSKRGDSEPPSSTMTPVTPEPNLPPTLSGETTVVAEPETIDSAEFTQPEEAKDDEFASFTGKKSKKDKKKKRKSSMPAEMDWESAAPAESGARELEVQPQTELEGESAGLEGTAERLPAGIETAEQIPTGIEATEQLPAEVQPAEQSRLDVEDSGKEAPEPKSKSGKKQKPKTSKKSGWGILAAAVAGTGAGIAAASTVEDEEPSKERGESKDHDSPPPESPTREILSKPKDGDTWDDDEDYFKAKSASGTPTASAESSFQKLELHPVVSGMLDESKGRDIDRFVSPSPPAPGQWGLMTLGDSDVLNDHIPKLLTTQSFSPTVDASPEGPSNLQSPREVPEAPYGPIGVDLTPAQDSSSIQHEPPFEQLSTPEKKIKTKDTAVADVPEFIPSGAEITTSKLDDIEILREDSRSVTPVPRRGESTGDAAADSGSQHHQPSAREIAAAFLGGEDDTSVRHVSFDIQPEDGMPPAHAEHSAAIMQPAISKRDVAASLLERMAHGTHEALGRPGEMPSRDESVGRDVIEEGDRRTSAHDVAASFMERRGSAESERPDVARAASPTVDVSSKSSEAPTARDIAVSYMERPPTPKESASAKGKGLDKTVEGDKDVNDAELAVAAGALTGGVAMLAAKFGGSKKSKGKQKQKKIVDKRSARGDDMFDDPSLWEGAERRPLEGSRMDMDSDNFWDTPEEHDLRPEISSTASRSTDRGLDSSDENGLRGGTEVHPVEEQPDDADFVESPVLGRRNSDKHRIKAKVPAAIDTSRDSTPKGEDRLGRPVLPSPPPSGEPSVEPALSRAITRDMDEMDVDEPRSRSHRHGEPLATTAAFLAREHDAGDFRRSLSGPLPPVLEEGHEEEHHEKTRRPSTEHARHVMGTPETNRDSGFMADSPHPLRRSHHGDDGHRDSGVHIRDGPEASPLQREVRRFSPEPVHSSRAALAADEHRRSGQSTPRASEREPRRSPLGQHATASVATPPILRGPAEQPRTPEPQKVDRSIKRATYQDAGLAAGAGAALAGAAAIAGAAASHRSVSDNSREQRASPRADTNPRRSASNTSLSRLRTPEPLNFRPDSPGSLRSFSGTPPLRRVDKRVSGDLRSLSQRGAAGTPSAAQEGGTTAESSSTRAAQNNTPVANEGRVRARDMTDVYDGYGEGRIGSPRSPTRPHSMRRRQSMQVLELESRVEQLVAENRLLNEARAQAEQNLTQKAATVLSDRDEQIERLKTTLGFLQKEVARLTEVNEGLNSAINSSAIQHNDRYRQLEARHQEASRELHEVRAAGHQQHAQTLQEKDDEIAELRAQLEATQEQVREMQRQILAAKDGDVEFLNIRDEDYFDTRCQQLCSHVQQWVLRFSKFSDMRACRLTSEINDEKIIDRLDNAVLDGTDVDTYLNDRVRRRDIFMSMTTTMIWEFVFTRYLFGMDREQRQKLKALEKLLQEVGPPQAVRQWRAVTLTLLSRRARFREQRDQDTEAVVQAVFQTLSMILPPPSNLEDQIQNQLRRVMREAVDLSIEMRCQRAEYMMLPPLQPEYDANGDLADTVAFNAALMNERSGRDEPSNEELEAAAAVVRVVLFPLVVKKGDDAGAGDDEIVVCPAQVLVAGGGTASASAGKRTRGVTPSSDAGGASLLHGAHSPAVMARPNPSNVSMADVSGQPPHEAEYIEGGI